MTDCSDPKNDLLTILKDILIDFATFYNPMGFFGPKGGKQSKEIKTKHIFKGLKQPEM